MSEKGRLKSAVEVLVYAPAGIVTTALEDLPGMIAKGRHEVDQTISNARVVGKLVVKFAGADLARRLGHTQENDGDDEPDDTEGQPERAPAQAGSIDGAPDVAKRTPAAARGEATALAIPDYDTLSASQVVKRLPGLSGEERRRIGAYEAAGRARKTILDRIE